MTKFYYLIFFYFCHIYCTYTGKYVSIAIRIVADYFFSSFTNFDQCHKIARHFVAFLEVKCDLFSLLILRTRLICVYQPLGSRDRCNCGENCKVGLGNQPVIGKLYCFSDFMVSNFQCIIILYSTSGANTKNVLKAFAII